MYESNFWTKVAGANMAQDYNHYPEAEIEVVQSIFDMTPESPVDLFEIPWPSDPHAQSETVLRLMHESQDESLDWGRRKKAYDFLNNKARELGRELFLEDGPPTEHLTPALLLWCIKVASGFADEPKRGSGRDPNEKFMRNLKILLAVRMLRTKHDCNQEYSIGLIAFVTGEKEGTVKSGLRRINDFFKASRV